jgi:hypothetical protein
MIYIAFLFNLILTIIIEGAVILLLFRRLEFVYYSMLCNILTNPALNLILFIATSILGGFCYETALMILESLAVLVEAYVLKLLCRFTYKKAIAVSGLMNIVSCTAGLLIYGNLIRF